MNQKFNKCCLLLVVFVFGLSFSPCFSAESAGIIFSGQSTTPRSINPEREGDMVKREEAARLVKVVIFAAAVQAARETSNPEQASKLQAYQLGDPSPDFDEQYPVRALLAQKSHDMLHTVKERCRDYLLRYPYWQSVYHAYLLESFGSAPLFTPNGKQFSMNDQVYAGRNEFAHILSQVYACGGGSEGWKGLVEKLSHHQLPKKCLTEIGNRLTEGLKADSQMIGSGLFQLYRSGQVAVIHNPLMAPMTGVVGFPKGWNADPVYVVGPWSTEKGLWTCISHELTHPILNVIRDKSEKFRATLDKTAHCFESVTENRWGYDEWASYFIEEFIRAATSGIEGGSQTQFHHHEIITDMIAQFEHSDWTLEELLIRTLERIEKESLEPRIIKRKRWKERSSMLYEGKMSLEGGRIFLPIHINGTASLTALLDTGAPIHVLNSDTVERLSLEKKHSVTVKGAGANNQVAGNFTGKFSLGFPDSRLELRHQSGVSMPLKQVFRYFGRHFDAIIGGPLFSRWVVELDFQNGMVRFHAPRLFCPNKDFRRVQIETGLGVPIIATEVSLPSGERISASLMFDTGASGLSLNAPFVSRHFLLEKIQPTVEGSEGGTGTLVSNRVGRISEIALAGYSIKEPILSLSLSDSGILATSKFDGIIGLDFISRFHIFVDYQGKALYLKPNESISKPFHQGMLGAHFCTLENDFRTIVIEKVNTGSPAQRAGLCCGDTLIEMNGVRAKNLRLDDISSFLEKPHQSVNITIRRGDQELSFSIYLEETL